MRLARIACDGPLPLHSSRSGNCTAADAAAARLLTVGGGGLHCGIWIRRCVRLNGNAQCRCSTEVGLPATCAASTCRELVRCGAINQSAWSQWGELWGGQPLSRKQVTNLGLQVRHWVPLPEESVLSAVEQGMATSRLLGLHARHARTLFLDGRIVAKRTDFEGLAYHGQNAKAT